MTKKKADIWDVKQAITLDDSSVNDALRKFEAPYVMESHSTYLNDDGETVHTFEITAWANDTFVWELLQWQLVGLVNLTDMRHMATNDDGDSMYFVIGTACQSD